MEGLIQLNQPNRLLVIDLQFLCINIYPDSPSAPDTSIQFGFLLFLQGFWILISFFFSVFLLYHLISSGKRWMMWTQTRNHSLTALCYVSSLLSVLKALSKKAKLKIKNSKCISKWSLSRIWHYNSSESAQWFDEFMPWYNESQLTHTHTCTHTNDEQKDGISAPVVADVQSLLSTTSSSFSSPQTDTVRRHIFTILLSSFSLFIFTAKA